MEVRFLSVEEVINTHTDQILLYGGSSEIRDYALLESAVYQPQAGFGENYLHTTIFEMASAYVFHLVNNHPFVDGNKRVGIAVALLFLLYNGYEMLTSNEILENLVLQIATGKVQKKEIAQFFEEHCVEFEYVPEIV